MATVGPFLVDEHANTLDAAEAVVAGPHTIRLNPDVRASQRLRHYDQRLARVRMVEVPGTACSDEPCVELQGDHVLSGALALQPNYINGLFNLPTGVELTGALSSAAETMGGSFGAGIVTTCCPADPIPANINLTITLGGSLNGSYPLVWVPANSRWEKITLGSCDGIALKCTSGAWIITKIGLGVYASLGGSQTCSPFVVTFTGVSLASCGGGESATLVFTL